MAPSLPESWATKRTLYDAYVQSLPPGVYEDLLGRPNQTYGPRLTAASSICGAAALCAIILRLVSRLITGAGLGKDDYTIVLALILSFVYTFLIVSTVALGFGKHIIYVNPNNGNALGKRVYAAMVILTAATYSVKLSILLLYRRIFPTRRFGIALSIVGVFCTAYFVASFLATVFQCLPVATMLSKTPHSCLNMDAQFSAYSIINMCVDIILLLLPMPLIWRLHMNKRRKMQTTAMFCIGLLACIASLLRAIYSFETEEFDETYYDAHNSVWVAVEINLAVVSACLPSLGPLLHRIMRGKQASSASSYRFGSSNPSVGTATSQSKTQSSGCSEDMNDKVIAVDIELSIHESWEDVSPVREPPLTADPATHLRQTLGHDCRPLAHQRRQKL